MTEMADQIQAIPPFEWDYSQSEVNDRGIVYNPYGSGSGYPDSYTVVPDGGPILYSGHDDIQRVTTQGTQPAPATDAAQRTNWGTIALIGLVIWALSQK